MVACPFTRRVAAAAVLSTTALCCPTFAALVIGAPDTPVTQNFNGLTTTSSLPSLNSGGWRMLNTLENPTFASGVVSPTLILQTATLNSLSGTANYSFRDGAATSDRALGVIFATAVRRHIMLEIRNDSASTLESLMPSWTLEKYRDGLSPLAVSFSHSSDGVTWLSSGLSSATFAASDSYTGTSSPTPTFQAATLSGLNIASGAFYYLRWEFARTGGSDQVPAVGIDDFSITGATHLPEASSLLAVAAAAGVAGLVARLRRRPSQEQ